MEHREIDVTQVMYRTDTLEISEYEADHLDDMDIDLMYQRQRYPLDELLQICARRFEELGIEWLAKECRAWKSSELIIQ